MKLLLLAQKRCHTQVMASLKTLAQVFLVVFLGMIVGYSDSESVSKTEVSWAAPHSFIHQIMPVGLLCAGDSIWYGGRLWSKTLIKQLLQEQLLNSESCSIC